MADCILKMADITKKFSGIRALDCVNLMIERGEIHALCGENGAGKSTLMNVLSGLYPYGSYDGEIFYDGKLCQFKDLKDSEEKGIVIIHQELALSPYLSVKENIFLGNEQAERGVIDWELTEKKTYELLNKVGLSIDPNLLVSQIGVGQQQLVEIAKALSKSVRLLILDEPTAALNEEESANLLRLIRELKEQGVTSIIISHKLNEIVDIADRITILRDGQTIETLENEMISEERIIRGMVGRDLVDRYPERKPDIGEVYFKVEDWTVYHPLDQERIINDHINLHLKKGEIVGIAGLMGAGRTEFAMSLFGHSYGSKISGRISKEGAEISVKTVPSAIANGLAYVSEDRKSLGLNLLMDIRENVTLSSLDKISQKGVLDKEKEVTEAENFRKKMRIKTNSIHQIVSSLSGGNQQKVVLSKWLMTQPDILFLDEPTRGIDVGAKYEIYTIIEEMAANGKAVCLISSELPEILGMCDRIYTMKRWGKLEQAKNLTDKKEKKLNLKSRAADLFGRYSMVIILAGLLIAFQLMTDGIFWRPLNITNLVLQNSHILVLAAGMLLVVLLGHVDLSVGSVMAFVGAIAGMMMVNRQMNPWVTVITCLAVGGLIGAWQGFWVAYAGIPAFIVTLAGLLMFRGLTQVVLGGQSLAPFPAVFQKMSTGYLPDLSEGSSLHFLTLILGMIITIVLVVGQWRTRNRRKNHLFEVESPTAFLVKAVFTAVVVLGITYIFASYQGYPIILIILGLIVAAYGFLTNKTVAGRQIYATGGNRKAAELSGIKTKRITFWVFVNMGVMAALAGLVLAARLNAATPQAGTSMELDAMAAVYFGGASTSGGIGTIMGAIVGGLVMGVLNNGMSILGVGVDWQQAIKGLILLLAVVLDLYNKKKRTT